MAHSNLQVLLGSSSTKTVSDFYVADCAVLSLSVQGSSKVSVSLSNSQGSDGNPLVYNLISVATTGIYHVEPGARWLRAERSTSTTTVLLNWSYEA